MVQGERGKGRRGRAEIKESEAKKGFRHQARTFLMIFFLIAIIAIKMRTTQRMIKTDSMTRMQLPLKQIV